MAEPGAPVDPIEEALKKSLAAAAVNGTQVAGGTPALPGTSTTKAEANGLKVYAGGITDIVPGLTKNERSVDDSKADFFRWSPKQRQEWAKHLIDSGVISPEQATWGNLQQAWFDANDTASALWTYGQHKVTPYDVVDMQADVGGAKAQGGPTSSTSTNTSVDLLNPTSAKDFLTKALAQGTGREPTDDLVNDFLATVQRAQKASPNVNTQTNASTGSGTGATSSTSSSTSSGGVDVGQLATDYANKQPDHDNYALETSFFQALTGAVQSPV